MNLLYTAKPWQQAAKQGFLEMSGTITSNLNDKPPISAEEQRFQDLLGRIVEQDQAAFASLYQLLAGRVYGLALTITRRVTAAEEVTEDTFWQIWRQAPRFDPTRGDAVTWILTIARSRALDALRKLDTIEQEREPTEPVNVADNPVDLLMAVEEGSLIHAALGTLDPVPRQLVALAFLRGLSHDEIATETGLPLGTVKSHIRRALIELKQILQAN